MLRDPGNIMTNFVLPQIDAAISLFTSLLAYGARTPRYKRNLKWLLNLRTRALSKVSEVADARKGVRQDNNRSARTRTTQDGYGDRGQEDHENDEADVELLGWRTRLIERAGQGGRQKVVKTIHLDGTPTDSQVTDTAHFSLNESYVRGHPTALESTTAIPAVTFDSTNDLVCYISKCGGVIKQYANVLASYATFGILCFCRTYLGQLMIS